jgi:hypothetical protein
MINIFDRTLKILARNHAATFLRLAFPNHNLQLLGTEENVEAITQVLKVSFPELPQQLVDDIHQIKASNRLKILLGKAVTIESVPQFEQLLIDLLPDE